MMPMRRLLLTLSAIALVTVVWWVSALEESPGSLVSRAAVLVLIAGTLVCLFGGTFGGESPLRYRAWTSGGPLAGMRLNRSSANSFVGLEDMSRRLVHPGDRVLFLAAPGGYLALENGIPLTNATWLKQDPSDGAASAYFERVGRWPDVVFIPNRALAAANARGALAQLDPLLARIERDYRVVEASHSSGFTAYSRK